MNALVSAESREVAATQNAVVAAGPMANAIAALQAGMTIESLRGIMELQKDWESNEARKAYVSDMAAFKLHPPQILKEKLVGYANRDGSITGYFHATLGAVVEAIVSELAKHGFSHNWETKQSGGQITVSCKITHRLGHSESTTMEAGADVSGKKNAIQSVASSITYLSRYTLLAATGLAAVDMPDDDGAGYDQPEAQSPAQAAPRQEQPQAPGLPPYPDDKFAQNLPTWSAMVQEGGTTPERVISMVGSRATLSPAQINRIKQLTQLTQ